MRDQSQDSRSTLSKIDSQVLGLHGAFDLPSSQEKERLTGYFMSSCWPWTPIIDLPWLEESGHHPPSYLLLHAFFLAGSRVSSEEALVVSEDYYRKAKALFTSNAESSALLSVVAAILLQWWSPTGPEQVSHSNSGFWAQIAIGLAFQIGLHREPRPGPYRSLRRRIWWSLVVCYVPCPQPWLVHFQTGFLIQVTNHKKCRDILISVGVGRPRIINPDDSNVLEPTIQDFPREDPKASVFIAYVGICRLLGDVAQCRRRGHLSITQKRCFEAAAYHWVCELPQHLKLFQDTVPKTQTPYNVESRQLHAIYFVILIILGRSGGSDASYTQCFLAASIIAGIYREFAKNDDVRHLGPVFAFHGLAASLSLLQAMRYAPLAAATEDDFTDIYKVLKRLAKRWGSARGLLGPLLTVQRSARNHKIDKLPEPLSVSAKPLFREFGPESCRLWCLCSEPGTTSQLEFNDEASVTNVSGSGAQATSVPAALPVPVPNPSLEIEVEPNGLQPNSNLLDIFGSGDPGFEPLDFLKDANYPDYDWQSDELWGSLDFWSSCFNDV